MRDTEVLRRRLWAIAGLPLSLWLSACDGGESPPKAVAKSEGEQAGKGGKQTPATSAGKGAEIDEPDEPPGGEAGATPPLEPGQPGWVPPYDIDQIPAGEFDYYGPARDPFGPHEEEEGCPNGDWCGSPEDARNFAVAHIPEQLACPAKLVANPTFAETADQKADKWKGFSFHPMMQGRLVQTVTKETRASSGDEQLCCYHWFDYCSGRPLLDGDTMILAELREGSSWSCPPEQVAAALEQPDEQLDAELRARVGELWLADARMEHASIVSFARAALELQAVAAPSELLAEVAQAGLDEVEHARLCFGLAARFSGRAREPGVLMPPPPRAAELVRLALDTFIEGCVGETIATLVATRAGRHCSDASVSAVLERIADDEGRHAALAWRTIHWLLDGAGERREELVRALAEQAKGMAEAIEAEPLPAADPQARGLAALGRLDARTEQLARRDAWLELILPTLDACLGLRASQARIFA